MLLLYSSLRYFRSRRLYSHIRCHYCNPFIQSRLMASTHARSLRIRVSLYLSAASSTRSITTPNTYPLRRASPPGVLILSGWRWLRQGFVQTVLRAALDYTSEITGAGAEPLFAIRQKYASVLAPLFHGNASGPTPGIPSPLSPLSAMRKAISFPPHSTIARPRPSSTVLLMGRGDLYRVRMRRAESRVGFSPGFSDIRDFV